MSERCPTRWERFRRKFFGVEPRHDCREYLPYAPNLKEGVVRVCSGCGTPHVRYDYDDDDDYGGTAWYCGWKKVE